MYYEFNDIFSLHLSHHGYSLLYEHITRYNYPSRYLCKCSTFNVSCEGDCWNSYLAIKFSDPLENPFTIQLDNRQREGETTPANVGPVRKECSFTVQLVNNKVSLYVKSRSRLPYILLWCRKLYVTSIIIKTRFLLHYFYTVFIFKPLFKYVKHTALFRLNAAARQHRIRLLGIPLGDLISLKKWDAMWNLRWKEMCTLRI